MKTITIQIGNSDDRLAQAEWAKFCKSVDAAIQQITKLCLGSVHFSGMSFGDAPWQNAAWVFNISSKGATRLKVELIEIKARFNQDAIAWTEGDTNFI